MSADIVTKTHIDALLTAGLVLPGRYQPLRWWPPVTTQDDDRGDVDRPNELTEETADRVGAMLWAENHRSVNHRYSMDEEGTTFEFVRLPGDTASLRGLVVVLSALRCYEYQSCEHPAWAVSEAEAFCHALRAAAIRRLPGYDTTPWEITDRDVFVKLASVTVDRLVRYQQATDGGVILSGVASDGPPPNQGQAVSFRVSIADLTKILRSSAAE